jgi:CubicO group peptidase (beta-lactamase class C family)
MRSKNNHYRVFVFAVLCSVSLLLSGCGSSSDTVPAVQGVFVDSPVEGLYYVTASISGKTDAKGTFSYYPDNTTISFYIGKPEDKGVFIGTCKIKSKITPLDLALDTSKDVLGNEVTNISRFLQTMDADGVPENGITITTQAETALKGKAINFDVDPTTFGDEMNTILNALNAQKVFADKRTLKTPAQARRHLRESLGLTVDAATAQKLQGAMDKVIAKYPWPGLVMGVRFPDGKTWFGTKGLADIANKVPMTIDHKLRIGSVTKTFTATVILQMAQEGLLGLDDTVEKWLPGILGNYQYHDKITIRQLLNHTSGLNNYWHLSMDPESLYYQEYFGGTWTKLWDPRELVKVTIGLPALFAPGTGWAYSNIGPILEAMIVEKITGEAFETVMTHRIIENLGLYNTYLPGDENIVAPHAQGYLDYLNLNGVYDAGDDCTYMNPSFAWASGAIVTSIEDLLRYTTALASGEMLNAQYQAERVNNMANILPDGSAKSGLGIMLINGALGHNGDIFGFQATVQRYKGVDFAVITNAQGLIDLKTGEGLFIPENPSTGNIAYVTFLQAIEDLGLTAQ